AQPIAEAPGLQAAPGSPRQLSCLGLGRQRPNLALPRAPLPRRAAGGPRRGPARTNSRPPRALLPPAAPTRAGHPRRCGAAGRRAMSDPVEVAAACGSAELVTVTRTDCGPQNMGAVYTPDADISPALSPSNCHLTPISRVPVTTAVS